MVKRRPTPRARDDRSKSPKANPAKRAPKRGLARGAASTLAPSNAAAAPARAQTALTKEDRAVLDAAIAQAGELHDAIDARWTSFGKWLFTHVFGEDTASVIEHRDENPIWTALYAVADSARLRVRHDELERSVLAAAYDKRLNSDAWRAIEFGRKWRLLKLAALGDDKILRAAAQHVLTANLDTRQVDEYVRAVRDEHQEPVATRVHVRALIGSLDGVATKLADKSFSKQLVNAAKDLSDEKRQTLVDSVERARDALDGMLRKLTDS